MDLSTHAIPPSAQLGFVSLAAKSFNYKCYLSEKAVLSSSFKLHFHEDMISERHTAIKTKLNDK